MQLRLTDTSLRDGSHHKRHQFTVDDVRSIVRTYDDLGRLSKITSYDAASGGGSVVNEVAYTYDGWGNVVKSQQAVDGAVGGGTPAVTYTYDDGLPSNSTNTAALHVRLSKVHYPGGRDVFYNYSTDSDNAVTTINDHLNRVSTIADTIQKKPAR